MKSMIVTGASRGIGAATALLAAKEGYAVVVNYLSNRQAADGIVMQILAGGGKAVAIQADVSEEDDVMKLFAEADRMFGSPASLVNNAGILEQQKRMTEMDVERFNRVFTANVISTFLCSREAIKRMSTRSGGMGGTIVNVSSVAAKTGSPSEYIDYAASKGAIDTLTIGLAKEVIDEGIRVNAVRPGFIYTDIHAAGGEPGRVDRLKPLIPMKRGGTAEEVAEAILFLATERSSYSTGTFIDVSGGR